MSICIKYLMRLFLNVEDKNIDIYVKEQQTVRHKPNRLSIDQENTKFSLNEKSPNTSFF